MYVTSTTSPMISYLHISQMSNVYIFLKLTKSLNHYQKMRLLIVITCRFKGYYMDGAGWDVAFCEYEHKVIERLEIESLEIQNFWASVQSMVIWTDNYSKWPLLMSKNHNRREKHLEKIPDRWNYQQNWEGHL